MVHQLLNICIALSFVFLIAVNSLHATFEQYLYQNIQETNKRAHSLSNVHEFWYILPLVSSLYRLRCKIITKELYSRAHSNNEQLKLITYIEQSAFNTAYFYITQQLFKEGTADPICKLEGSIKERKAGCKGYVAHIQTENAFRKKGYASLVLAEFEKHVKKAGGALIQLDARKNNKGLFLQNSFQTDLDKESIFSDHDVMQKNLKA
jgi:Na+/phosphate symporter